MHTHGALSLRVGLDALRANPLRTFLSTLGVIMGVGSMVAVLSIGDGVETLGREQVARTTDLQSVVLAPRTTQQLDGIAVGRADTVCFGPEEMEALRAAAPHAGTAVLRRSASATVQRDSASPRRGVLMTSAVPAIFATRSLAPAAGVLFTKREQASGREVAVVSASTAAALAGTAPGSSLVGQRVLVNGHPVSVIGVLAPREHEAMEIFTPFVAAGGSSPATMLFVAQSVEATEPMRAEIESWLARRYGPAWQDRVRLLSNRERLAQLAQALLIYKLLMGSITGVALLVGGIGIMNVLLASVTERTREIGIRKAAGARNRDILAQFLAESVAISGAGATLGVLLGLGVAGIAAAVMRYQAHAAVQAAVTPSTILSAALASIVVGLSFGLYPALRASRLSPIDAIRHE